jgi:predicted nucleic acid-binding protein
MILLDTNVVSDSLRDVRDANVQRWFNGQRQADLFLCAPVLAQLRYGVERLPAGRRRDRLDEAIRDVEENIFADRILGIDSACAHLYGRIAVQREKLGRPLGVMDGLIAAVALVHGATLATRDTAGFANLGIDLVNPFASGRP